MKDKNVAGILAIFLGWLGIHRFYLGQVGHGILYSILLFFGGISFILGFIDAIVFFSMDEEKFNEKYNKQFYRASSRRDTDFVREDHQYNKSYRRKEDRRDFRKERERRQISGQNKAVRRPNPFLQSGIKKYKDYDYDGAIEDFGKALQKEPKNPAIHFNLACTHSLNENVQEAFFHLDKAVEYGFDDFKRIKEHEALAFLRIQKDFEKFEENDFRLIQKLEAPKQDLLESSDPLLDQLKKLAELREKGLLTDEEFTTQKKKLLG